MAAPAHQPARGFGKPAVEEIEGHDGEPAHDEGHAPRRFEREGLDRPRAAEGRQQVGGREDGVADAHEDAPVSGRGDFGNHQVGKGKDRSRPEPADEAHGHDPREVGVKAADERKEGEDEDAPEEDALAPETVGQKARAGRADDHARRGAGTEQAQRVGVEFPYLFQHGHDLPDHAQIEGFHDPAPREQSDKRQDRPVQRHSFHAGKQIRFNVKCRHDGAPCGSEVAALGIKAERLFFLEQSLCPQAPEGRKVLLKWI